MADTTGKSLKVVVVTPERAVLDEPAEMVILPMYDGERGVLIGHAPFVGQLGPGELRIKQGGAVKRYFIEGGFAQVSGSVVNVLTAKATAAEKVNRLRTRSLPHEGQAIAVTTWPSVMGRRTSNRCSQARHRCS